MRRPLLVLACALTLGACDDDTGPADDTPERDAGLTLQDAAAPLGDAVVLDSETSASDAELPVLDASPGADGALPDGGGPAPEAEVVIVDGPDDAPDRFGAPGDCADPPAFIYPEPGTALPRNIEAIDFQWDAGRRGGESLYEVEMRAGDLTVRWYTAADHLVPAGAPWARLKEAAARANPLTITVNEHRGDGAPSCPSAALPIEISPSELRGAVYYWSTGQVAIMRLPVNDTEAEPFINGFNSGNGCPACHALSRDGSRVAYTRTTFPPFGNLAVAAVDEPGTMLYDADADATAGYFPSFSPDGLRIVAGSSGKLVIRSSDTGERETIMDAGGNAIDPIPLAPMTVAGSPDWSWQGDRIAAALGPAGLFNPIPDVGISSGDIAQWSHVDGAWQLPVSLVEASPEWWYDRPAYSPLGRWIAYNRIGDNPFGANDEDQEINPNTDLWLVPPDGGDPIPLDAANGGELMGNSWPKWAPLQGGAGRVWLAFTSLRPYGRVLPNQPGVDATPQIWVAGIDPNAPPGADPSAPGFWMPGQSTRSGNHAPYWAPYEKE